MKTVLLAAYITLLTSGAFAQQPKPKAESGGADAKASKCCKDYGGSWDTSTQPGRCLGLSQGTRPNFGRCAGRL